MSESSYNIDNARHAQQSEQMKDLAERGVCAFCWEHFDNEHREPIELKTDHWIVTKNDYPYDRTSLHLILIPREHVGTLSELSQATLHDLTDTIVAVEKKWQLTHYGVGIRSGDMRYTGGTVEHLHAHIIVGDIDDPEHEPVRFKVSSRPKDSHR